MSQRHDDHEPKAHEHGEGEQRHNHTFNWQAELEAMRDEATHYYRDHFDWRGHAPPAGFTGPRFYPPDPDWRLAARLDRNADGAGRKVTLATSTGQLREMQQVGELVFEVQRAEHRLTAFLTRDSEGFQMLFVPFRDGTSGTETYGAGRYVEVPFEDEAVLLELDFNLAYNPSCVFSPAYDCPYPPSQNRLTIPVRAGEMLPFDQPAA